MQVAANDASPIAKVADPWPPLLIIIIIIIIVVIIVVIISMVILLLIIHIYCSYYYLHSPALGKHTVASFLFKSPQLGNLDLELISLSLSLYIYIYIYTHTRTTHTQRIFKPESPRCDGASMSPESRRRRRPRPQRGRSNPRLRNSFRTHNFREIPYGHEISPHNIKIMLESNPRKSRILGSALSGSDSTASPKRTAIFGSLGLRFEGACVGPFAK